MKLKNKKTGEILESARTSTVIRDKFRIYDEVTDKYYTYNSIAELNEEWEDYEEPKKYWYISPEGEAYSIYEEDDGLEGVKASKEIGNYFSSKEEAEKAVEKLKAWKRLKDKGFRLSAVVDTFFCLDIYIKDEPYELIKDDLKIVFGGEE